MIFRKQIVLLLIGVFMAVFCAGYLAASPTFEKVSESGIRVLEVEASFLNVEVNGGTGSTVTGWGEDISRNVIVNYKRRGDVLHIWVEKRFSPFALRQSGRLYFEVPEDVDLDLRSASGEIVIRNMSPARLRAESSSGNISISRIGSDLEVKNASGDINLGMIDGNVRVENSSGRIELTDVNGNVSAGASSGDLRLSAVEGDIEASSNSGRIALRSTTGALHLHTSSGAIHGEDVYITGASMFETGSGRIDVDLRNQLNDLSFRLTSSSGALQVGNLKGERNLAAGEGTIRVTGETSSGSQLFR